MPNIIIGMWYKDYVRHAVTDVGAMVDALTSKVRTAFHHAGDDRDFYVFLVPEFYFTKNELDDSRPRWLDADERQEAIDGVHGLSRARPNLLLAGGTICSYQNELRADKEYYLVQNAAPVAYRGAELALYHKKLEGGERSGADALVLYRCREGDISLDYQVKQKTKVLGIFPGEKKVTRQYILQPGAGLWKASRESTPGMSKAYDEMWPRIQYETIGDDPVFSLPGGTGSAGIEICQEHNLGTLKKSSAEALSLHLLVSNSVSYKADSVHIREGGYFLYCDTQTWRSGHQVEVMQGGTLVDRSKTNRTEVEKDLHVWQFPLTAEQCGWFGV